MKNQEKNNQNNSDEMLVTAGREITDVLPVPDGGWSFEGTPIKTGNTVTGAKFSGHYDENVFSGSVATGSAKIAVTNGSVTGTGNYAQDSGISAGLTYTAGENGATASATYNSDSGFSGAIKFGSISYTLNESSVGLTYDFGGGTMATVSGSFSSGFSVGWSSSFGNWNTSFSASGSNGYWGISANFTLTWFE